MAHKGKKDEPIEPIVEMKDIEYLHKELRSLHSKWATMLGERMNMDVIKIRNIVNNVIRNNQDRLLFLKEGMVLRAQLKTEGTETVAAIRKLQKSEA